MSEITEKLLCYHCGDECKDESVADSEKLFCCIGCKLVYKILLENNLCTYYELNKNPGIKQDGITEKRFNFLSEPSVVEKLISFRNGNEIHVIFHISSMHCSSCIWLLENFKKVDPGVISSKVNFLNKEIHFVFDSRKTSLKRLVEELTQTGYEPSLQLDSIEKKKKKQANRGRILRIGIAGFCFGNIMMLSFPEYFSSGKIIDAGLKQFFSYMNLLIALPVFIYSASEFFINSYRAVKHKSISIDVPIAIGIATIFISSMYAIISETGAGYLDSGSGLVFFMLVGRWFQDFTFNSIAFDRDFKSYFPISVTTVMSGIERDVIVNDLKKNDRILIRNNEIVPVDSLLLKGIASIDYHFVTGESMPVLLQPGETVFAGGKQIGPMIELQVTREISESYLTQLWNNKHINETYNDFEKIVKSVSRWFIYIVLFIAISTAAYWWKEDITKAIMAFTAVLIIACPCALALSAPFTFGNILRILGKNKIYLRNYHVLENLADINVVVFDKTGTLTKNNTSKINFVGEELTKDEEKLIYSLTRQSLHPLSKMICKEIVKTDYYHVNDLKDIPGLGISANIEGSSVKIGNLIFAGDDIDRKETMDLLTKSYVSINRKCKGYYVFSNSYREGIRESVNSLVEKNYSIAVLTGDNESEKDNLNRLFSHRAELRFKQSPTDKLSFINCLHENELKVLMIGDGLNDAGALLQSDVGISLTDNTNSFTPASDAIVDASQLSKISNLLEYSKSAIRIIIISFIISLLYNFVGLSFAVTGKLSPMIASILMPISTISLVLFTVISSSVKGRMLGFK